MRDIIESPILTDKARRILTVALTVGAALLYAAVLGYAIVLTLISPDQPQFSSGLVRAAGLLSGLVGSVVTAGFANSKQPGSVSISAPHPMGGRVATSWNTLRPPSRVRSKLIGLGELLGLRTPRTFPSRTTPSRDGDSAPLPPTPTEGMGLQGWIGLLYFAVYFVTGAAAFVVSLFKMPVPELVDNAGGVFLGTIITSAYTFFAPSNKQYSSDSGASASR